VRLSITSPYARLGFAASTFKNALVLGSQMAVVSMKSWLAIDLSVTSPKAILRQLMDYRENSLADPALSNADFELKITQAAGNDFVGAGVRCVSKVSVVGNLGDYGFCSFGEGQGFIEGKVGAYFGHSIHSGILIVHSHASHSVGALGTGGTIAIYGNAGDRVAVGMQGSDVVIRGSVGHFAGLGLQSGCLVIGGNAGTEMGKGMRDGTIYLRGEAESISSDIEEQRLREPDRLKIGLLLLKAGIKSAGKDFRVYRSVKEYR
jgi:methylamine---glutamate N-methyltransferase subunit B